MKYLTVHSTGSGLHRAVAMVFRPFLGVLCTVSLLIDCSSSSNSTNNGTGGMPSGGGTQATGGRSSNGGTSNSIGGQTSNSVGGRTSSSIGGQTSTASIPTFSRVYTSIIVAGCLPCHTDGPGQTTGMLDMSSQSTAYTNLVGTGGGVDAAGSGCAGRGLKRVTPGNASTSVLWEKVNSQLQGTAAICGLPMPSGFPALAQGDIDSIAAWINGGGKND